MKKLTYFVLGLAFITGVGCDQDVGPKHDGVPVQKKTREGDNKTISSEFKMSKDKLPTCIFSFRPWGLKVLDSISKVENKIDTSFEKMDVQMNFKFVDSKGLNQDFIEDEEVYFNRYHHLYEDSNPQSIRNDKGLLNVDFSWGPREFSPQSLEGNTNLVTDRLQIQLDKLGFHKMSENVKMSLPEKPNYDAEGVQSFQKDHYLFTVQVFADCPNKTKKK